MTTVKPPNLTWFTYSQQVLLLLSDRFTSHLEQRCDSGFMSRSVDPVMVTAFEQYFHPYEGEFQFWQPTAEDISWIHQQLTFKLSKLWMQTAIETFRPLQPEWIRLFGAAALRCGNKGCRCMRIRLASLATRHIHKIDNKLSSCCAAPVAVAEIMLSDAADFLKRDKGLRQTLEASLNDILEGNATEIAVYDWFSRASIRDAGMNEDTRVHT